jgi:hypothetical protein
VLQDRGEGHCDAEATMTGIVSNERGIALPIAIFALVVVGALVAGAFFAGTQEQRLAANAKRVTQSFGIAEAGLAERVRLWDPVLYNQQPTYPLDSALVPDTTAPFGTGSYGGFVYKLNDNLFLTDIRGMDTASATGRVHGGGARQRLGLLTRIRPLDIDIQASLTTQGDVTVRGNAVVNGADGTPTGWVACDPPGDSMAAVRTTPGGVVNTSGANAEVIGDVDQDPDVDVGTFTVFGDVTYAELVDRATLSLPGGRTYQTEPSLVGGVCDRSDPENWGDGLVPTDACGRYFPIVHISGNATLNGIQGQGILLVDGDLDVQGSYEFFGIAIVQGEFKTSGGGTSIAHFWGGVLARNASLDTQNISGQATLNYSSCAIQRALQATGATAPLRSRGWAALY